ncbi:hypothetical protein, partial [Maioricimonas sp. JC845]|uniref:hypothetical protein n=1 Tax=Maioricimonas sp. JC845 TaxID=3232138 RepID=UPI0034597F0E
TGGGNDLTIMGGGLFAAAVSGVGAFAADTIDTESTLDASTVTVTGAAEIGGDVTTTGDQEYGGAVTLTADVTFTGVDLDMDGAGVEFSQLVDGGGNGLAVAGGAAFDNGIVNVSSLTVIGATTIAGDVTTTGQQVYDGPVTLAANVVLTGVDTDADGEGVE